MKRDYEKLEVNVITVKVERGFAGSVGETYDPYSMDGFIDEGEVGM